MTIKVAVLGCGYWGKNIVRKFHELGSLAAICDANADVAAKFSSDYQVPAVSYDAILADDAIDAVAVTTPAQMHHSNVIAALNAGKHVFVEKPISLNNEEAAEMTALAEEKGLTLMVGHLLQYHPAFLKLKEMVAAGELGDLRYIYSRRLNLGKIRTHEDVLWSFAPHDISMILALAGESPDTVNGFGSQFVQDDLSDFFTMQMKFGNGIRAHVDVSWLNPFKEQRLVVVGEKGMIEFDDRAPWAEKLKLFRHVAEIQDGEPVVQAADAELIELEEAEPLLNECAHFLRFVENKETPYTDGKEAMRVLDVLIRAGE